MNTISLSCCSFLLFTFNLVNGQNVGIGTSEPKNKLQVHGNLLINAPYIATNTPPTPAQTKSMINNSTITFMQSDSTYRIYDPGGAVGNYNSNLIAFAQLDNGPGIGFEITLVEVGLGTGDSLTIREVQGGLVLLAIGNGYTNPGSWVFHSSNLHITFKSNSDANNGSGFNLLIRRLFDGTTLQPNLTGFTGKSFFFDSKKAALRSGKIGNEAKGLYSVALGFNCIASGDYSVALNNSTATGLYSFATGSNNSAIGGFSTALGNYTVSSGVASFSSGFNTHASGNYSLAMGADNSVSGHVSTTMGTANNVYGNYSTAIGTKMEIYANQPGSFAAGDWEQSTDPIQVTGGAGENTFTARFRGGYYFLTSQNAPAGNYANRTGVICATGQNSWSAWSDVNRKENFLPVDGEYFLNKIAAMPQYSWNYKAQSPKEFRHYGPMAQDIFNAFGKDEFGTIGNDTMINQQDLLGIEFISIQALEKRTRELQDQLAEALSIIKSLSLKVDLLEKQNSNEDNSLLIKREDDDK